MLVGADSFLGDRAGCVVGFIASNKIASQDWAIGNRLQDYLLYDNWVYEQGILVLVGLNYFLSSDIDDAPNGLVGNSDNWSRFASSGYAVTPLDYLLPLTVESNNWQFEYQQYIFAMKASAVRLNSLWVNGHAQNKSYSPEYFIDWALSKRFRPHWLDWAIEQKLYTPKELRNLPAPAQNTPAAPEFDKASPTYPPELAYALEAWRAVSATEGKGKPKARIKAWLDTNTKLSDKAKERIAVVANWEKLGGATSTE